MYRQALENNVLHHQVDLYGENEKVSLFFISDVHMRKIDDEMLKKINQSIDAVIIGGDFADRRTSFQTIYHNILLLVELAPVYFVWGNNDREVGEEKLRRLFKDAGVKIIENDALILPNIKNKCWLCAIDDIAMEKEDYLKAFSKCKGEENVIFVSHNPEAFPIVRQQYQAILMLGGHYHGGQIRLGSIGLQPHGSFTFPRGVATLISNGYGTTNLPLRLGAKPQCHIIDLNFKQ